MVDHSVAAALVRQLGKLAVPLVVLTVGMLWLIAHVAGKPGERVSVLFGLVEYTKNEAAGRDTALATPVRSTLALGETDTTLSLSGFSRTSTKWDALKVLGKPDSADTAKDGSITWRYFPLEEPYEGMNHAIMISYVPRTDKFQQVAVLTPYGVRMLRNLGHDDPKLSVIGKTIHDLIVEFGKPEEDVRLSTGAQAPQFKLAGEFGAEARMRVLCDSTSVCNGLDVSWDPRNWARRFAK
jgi:hypothetical protein